MTPDDDKISSFQLGVFIFNIILGVGILTLPATLAKSVENDAWILCILSGAVNILFIYFMCSVGNKYAGLGLVGILKKMFGGFFGTLLALPVFAYYIFFYGVEIRLFAETAKIYLLQNTPLELIIVPLLILTVFLTRCGIEPTARFFEIVTPFIVLVLGILITVTLPKSNYSNLRPVLGTPVKKYVSGAGGATFAYAGFEILLVIFPFLRSPKKAFKVSSMGVSIIIVLYAIVTIQCLARFGVKETASLIYPTMSLVRASQVPGGFIERIDGLLLALWVVFVFTTLAALMFAFSIVGADLLKHKKRKHVISMAIPIVYMISLSGENVAELFDLSDKLMYTLGVYTIIILPTIMFIASLFKRKGGGPNES